MTNLLEEFRGELQGLAAGEVGAAVEMLAAALDPPTARVFRLIAIPHQFTLDLLSVLEPSLTPRQATEVGEKLLRLSVILPGDREFSVHDEVRDYLFRQWLQPTNRDEFTAVSTRLVKHFAEHLALPDNHTPQLDQNRTMFHAIGADPDGGFARFLDLLVKARKEYRLDDCERLIALVEEYHGWLAPHHQAAVLYQAGKLNADRHQWAAALESFETVSRSAAAGPQLRIKALTRAGTAHGHRAEWPDAIESFERAFALASESEECRKDRSWILHEWGVTLLDKGDSDEAEGLLLQRVALAEADANWVGLAAGNNALGGLYRQRGDYRKAIQAYEVALRHLQNKEETFRSAQVYNNLGRSLADIGEWKRSEECLQRSLEIKRRAGDTRGQAVSQSNLMRTYWNLGNRQQAALAAQSAVELFQQVNDIPKAAAVSRDAARLSRRDNRATAEHAYRKAIDLFNRARMEVEAKAVEAELSGLGGSGSVWHLVGNATKLTFKHFGSVVMPYAVLVAPLQGLQLWAQMNDRTPLMLVAMALSLLVSCIAYGVIAVSISEACLGNKPSLSRSFSYVFRQGLIGQVLIASLLQTALILVGLLLLVIPGLVLLTWLAFTPVVVVLEHRSALQALRRSKSLGSGYHWRTAGILAVLIGMLVLGGWLVGRLLESLIGDPSASWFGDLVWQVACTPIVVSTLILLYYDLRARKEAFDTAGPEEDLVL